MVGGLSILIIALQGIGNVLLATPLMHIIKKRFPHSKVSILLLENGSKGVIEGNPDVDEMILIPKEKQSLFSSIPLIFQLRCHDFDMAIVTWPGGIRSALLAFLSGAKARVGHAQNSLPFRMLPFLYTTRVKLKGHKHDLERNLDLAKALGLDITAAPTQMHMTLSKEDHASAARFLMENDVPTRGGLIGIHPGSGTAMAYKRWPKERFAVLADRLAVKYYYPSILFAGPKEVELAKEIAAKMRRKPLIAGGLELKKVAALIQRCRVFIGNDSGLMHLAVAMNVPTVGIFGPTDPRRTAPYGKCHQVVRKGLDCSPCFRFEKRNFGCRSLKCLEELTDEDVMQAVADVLVSEGVSNKR